MGIDTQRFVKQVPDKLLCAKCENVLVKPKQCKVCSMMVCRDCLDETTSKGEKPCNCGGQYIGSNKFLLNKLKGLLIKCRYYPDGCSFTAKLGEISKHEVNCYFQNSSMSATNRDPFSTKNKGGAQKVLKPVANYADLPEAISPFSEKTYFITCRKGCQKQILTKKEYETHSCVDHLKNIIKDQNKEKEMLNEHLQEAEKDVEDLLQEFNRCKDNQETVIDELKEKLMFLEKKNENLKNERVRRTKDYEERLSEEKVKSEKELNLAFINFVQTAEKDFTLYTQRINTDFSNYKDKLKEETTTYQLKTKANSVAKETNGYQLDSMTKSQTLSKKKSATTTPKSSRRRAQAN